MEHFQWDRHFVTGLDEVDKQHHQLVDLINRFSDALTDSKGTSGASMEKIFSELADYAHYHFTEEEGLMAKLSLDARHVEHHKQEHVSFLEEVVRIHSGITPESAGQERSLLRFLIYWLAYHILGSDQSMARQIASIQSGQTPEHAYLEEERMKEGAVEPLLHALTGLFHLVSERNRDLQQLNQTLEQKVVERTLELALANQQLEEIAMTDVLTGLPNRRHAMRRLSLAWEEAAEQGAPLCCMMVDADNFKPVNDSYGHDAGDEVLRQVARHMRYAVRTDDIVCRLGGDEFFVICPQTPLAGALQLAEKMRAEVAGLRIKVGSGEWQGSISIGVAERKHGMQSSDDLLKAADQAVYEAKRKGRNCVATAG
jgi:diguanylate cyclase (GGDEF)-like protein/hemerythrin-like metal-binding protein